MARRSVPTYSKHSSGQARVRIDGQTHYLGEFGSAESHAEYARLIDDWRNRQDDAPRRVTVRMLTLLYLRHAKRYYRKGGKVTTEYPVLRDVLKRLVRLHGKALAGQYNAKLLQRVQRAMIGDGLVRASINKNVSRIRMMFNWGHVEGMVPTTVLVSLGTVKGLRRGRSEAKESAPARPISEADVNATLPHVSAQVRDMIRLQLLTGCRPAEVCALRPIDVNREGDVWEYVPESHKTEHHGRERRIYIGLRAQVVLAGYLDNRPAESPCFSPAEAEGQRHAKQRAERKTRVQPSQQNRRRTSPKRRPRDRYTAESYRRAVARGCVKAKVDPWSPNRLRHSRATDLRRQYVIEAARVTLGHASEAITEVYAERDMAAARSIMAECG